MHIYISTELWGWRWAMYKMTGTSNRAGAPEEKSSRDRGRVRDGERTTREEQRDERRDDARNSGILNEKHNRAIIRIGFACTVGDSEWWWWREGCRTGEPGGRLLCVDEEASVRRMIGRVGSETDRWRIKKGRALIMITITIRHEKLIFSVKY